MPNFVESWRKVFRDLLVAALGRLVDLFFSARSKYYSEISIECHVACFVEIWSRVADGKPVDRQSALYAETTRAIDYYFGRTPATRKSFGVFERTMLPASYVAWLRRHEEKGLSRKIYKFVLKNRIAGIIKHYRNIQSYINFLATTELESLGPFLAGEESGAFYWKEAFVEGQLPAELKGGANAKRVRRYLRKKVTLSKRSLAEKNYYKIDFSLSDLTAAVALSVTLLLLMGYIHVAIVNSYFGVPWQRYYAATDYIDSAIDSIGFYLVSAFMSGVVLFYQVSTANAYSVNVTDRRVPLIDRFHGWLIHFLGVSSMGALVIGYIRDGRIDSTSFFFATAYIGYPLIVKACIKFFVDPVKSLVIGVLVFTALVNSVSGAIRVIGKIESSQGGTASRVLQFGDGSYAEPDWWVIAFTSGFVILRRQADGQIQVRIKSDLKRIDGAAGPAAPLKSP